MTDEYDRALEAAIAAVATFQRAVGPSTEASTMVTLLKRYRRPEVTAALDLARLERARAA